MPSVSTLFLHLVLLIVGGIATSFAQSAPQVIDNGRKGWDYTAKVLGNRLELPIQFTSSTPVSIQWYRNGQPLQRTDNVTSGRHSLTLDSLRLEDAGTYWATITNPTGTTQSPWTAVHVGSSPLVATPEIAILPAGPAHQQTGGTSLTLWLVTSTPDSTPTETQWFRDGVPIVGATLPVYFAPYATTADSGTYTVMRGRAHTPPGTALRVTITEGASPAQLPFVHSIFVPSSTIGYQQPIHLGCVIAGAGNASYAWYRDGTLLRQFTGPELHIGSATPADAGTYSLVVRNQHGSIHALTASIRVSVGSISPVLEEPLPSKVELIPNVPVTLRPNFVSDTARHTVQWYRNGQPINPSFTPSITLSNSSSTPPSTQFGVGTYTVAARDNYGTTTSNPMVVTLAPPHAGGIYWGTNDPFLSRTGSSSTGVMVFVDKDNIAQVISLGSWDFWSPSLPWVKGSFVAENVPLSAGQGVFKPQPAIASSAESDSLTLAAGGGRLTIKPASSTVAMSASRVTAGSMLAQSGYYRGFVSGIEGSTVRAIVAPDTTIAVCIAAGGVERSEISKTEGTRLTSRPFSLTINQATGVISGQVDIGGTTHPFTATRVKGLTSTQLVNVSSRGVVGSGDRAMIAGFALAGAGQRRLLLRGVGPTLASFGVQDALPDTILSLFQGSHRLAQNDNWGAAADATAIGAAASSTGAFALPSASRDAALLSSLSAGSYTVQLSDNAGREGVALMELYDADADQTGDPSVSNLSIRGFGGSGDQALIAGLVVSGINSKRLLIRAVGPSLASFGVTTAMVDPVLRLFRNDALVQWNNDWSNDSLAASAAAIVGAFQLERSSKDSAIVIELPPGNYTAQVTSRDGGPGAVLVEVYTIP